MDIKKILFKYGDKAVFVVFLAILAFSVFKLVSSGNINNSNNVANLRTNVSPVDPEIMVESDSRAVNARLTNPPYPDAGNDIATDPDKLEPLEGEKKCPKCGWFVKVELEVCPNKDCRYHFKGTVEVSKDKDRDGLPDDWEMKYFGNLDQGPKDDPDGDGFNNKEEYEGNSDPTDPNSIPQILTIVEIGQEPVDILFKGFIVHEGGDPEKPDPAYWALEINWGRNTKTKIIQYGGYFHGYRLFPLRKEVKKVFNPRLGEEETFEIWTLTIQKKRRKPIAAIRNTEVREQESYVIFKVLRGKDKGQTTPKLYDSDRFIVNGDAYTVISVSENEVVLLDKNKKSMTLRKGM